MAAEEKLTLCRIRQALLRSRVTSNACLATPLASAEGEELQKVPYAAHAKGFYLSLNPAPNSASTSIRRQASKSIRTVSKSVPTNRTVAAF